MNTRLISTWNIEFRIMRLIDRQLQAIECSITFDLDFDPRDDNQLQQLHLSRMRTWINEVLDGSVAFNVHNDSIDTAMLGMISNQIMFCPGEPYDYMLLALITAKLNAIGAGYVIVNNSTIVVDTSGGFSTTMSGDTDDLLPSGEEWMGPVRYWDQPWWNRADGGMTDIPMNEGDDREAKPDILISLDSDDIPSLPIKQVAHVEDQSDRKTAEIIRPDFRRRSIDD
jgi:hypothetical protein